jgi:two-component system NtrC family sensor kinase
VTVPLSIPRTMTPAAGQAGAAGHPPAESSKLPKLVSLSTELLVGLAVLATGALLLAVLSVLLFDDFVDRANSASYLAALIVLDVAVFIIFGASGLRRLVTKPLERVVATTEAIAAGDLTRRVTLGGSLELDRLANGVNKMTTRILEEQAMLARLEKVASLGRLATNVAHEIGNPLAAINGYTYLLRSRGGLAGGGGAEVADVVGGIERESARIDRIVRGMLDYARPRRRSEEAVDVNRVVNSVVDLLRSQGSLRDVKVRLALDSALPGLQGDNHDLEQALVNLVLNAVDALNGMGDMAIVTQRAPFNSLLDQSERRADDPSSASIERHPNPRVRTWLATVGEPRDVLQILIADSGPGVPLSDRERIFDPFYTTKDPGKGTGLGLAIVSRIVESMDGVIYARSAREGGVAFVILFAIPTPDKRQVGGGGGGGTR